MRRVVSYPDADTLAAATAARALTTVADVLSVQETCHLVLTGGSVGIASLDHMAQSPVAQGLDWERVHVWWSDERFVATGHEDRNEGQAQRALLSHVRLPEENIHRMGSSSDFDAPETAAAAYHDNIAAHGSPAWDLLILGLGPDGHVASLFPGHRAYTANSAGVVAIHDSPKPPAERVTMGLSAINRAQRIWVVAAGQAKADVVASCLKNDEYYPGAAVRGTHETLWLLDAAALSAVE